LYSCEASEHTNRHEALACVDCKASKTQNLGAAFSNNLFNKPKKRPRGSRTDRVAVGHLHQFNTVLQRIVVIKMDLIGPDSVPPKQLR
jgi:hypothetical protein